LGILADEGLLEKVPYRGAFVTAVSIDAIAEITSLRKLLEPYAIELALPKMKGSTHRKVTRALKDMAAGAANNDSAATIVAHMSFHRAFYELSDHNLLLDLWRGWETQLQLFFSADHPAFSDLHGVITQHHQLLNVIGTGDLDAIAAEIDHHTHGGLAPA